MTPIVGALAFGLLLKHVIGRIPTKAIPLLVFGYGVVASNFGAFGFQAGLKLTDSLEKAAVATIVAAGAYSISKNTLFEWILAGRFLSSKKGKK